MEPYKIILEHDYETLCSWWKGYDVPVIPQDLLSDCGVIVFKGDKKICAGFLYTTNSKVCYIENFIADPNASKEDRSLAIDKLFEELIFIAKHKKNKLILSSSNHPNLIDKGMKKFNFKSLPEQKIFAKELN